MIIEKTKGNPILSLYLSDRKAIIDHYLLKLSGPHGKLPSTLYESMHYSLSAGGKRIRPVLSIASCEAVGGTIEDVIPAAIAIEMIHTYSLIHDDLPAMDNDDLRRGKPTNHKVFGEATAILAGDGLLTLAFGILSNVGISDELVMSQGSQSGMKIPPPLSPLPQGEGRYEGTQANPPPLTGGGEGEGERRVFSGEKEVVDRRLRIIQEIALAAGPEGMVGGQHLDMENEGKNLDVRALEELHQRKTGALILAAVRAGGIAGGATEIQLQALTGYGTKIGLAFQIADDVLDVEGDVEDVGKSIGKDAKQNKNTYPAILGLTESKILARQLVNGALTALGSLDEKADPLRMIAEYIVDRKS